MLLITFEKPADTHYDTSEDTCKDILCIYMG